MQVAIHYVHGFLPFCRSATLGVLFVGVLPVRGLLGDPGEVVGGEVPAHEHHQLLHQVGVLLKQGRAPQRGARRDPHVLAPHPRMGRPHMLVHGLVVGAGEQHPHGGDRPDAVVVAVVSVARSGRGADHGMDRGAVLAAQLEGGAGRGPVDHQPAGAEGAMYLGQRAGHVVDSGGRIGLAVGEAVAAELQTDHPEALRPHRGRHRTPGVQILAEVVHEQQRRPVGWMLDSPQHRPVGQGDLDGVRLR